MKDKINTILSSVNNAIKQNIIVENQQVSLLNDIHKFLNDNISQNDVRYLNALDNINKILSDIEKHKLDDIAEVNTILQQNLDINTNFAQSLNDIKLSILSDKDSNTVNKKQIEILNKIVKEINLIHDKFNTFNKHIIKYFNTLLNEAKSISVSFPRDNSSHLFRTGLSTINVITGKVLFPNGSSDFLSKNLKSFNINVAKSMRIETSETIRVRTDNEGGWYIVSANDFLQHNFISFKTVEIETFKPTKISFFANTNPASLIKKTMVHLTVSNTPILVFDDWHKNTSVYETLVEYIVPDKHVGYINDISIGVASGGEPFAQFELSIDDTSYFTNKFCIGQVTFSFLGRVKFEKNIKIRVKSDGTTNIIANGLISGIVKRI